ncbi:MAG: hypothetical protein IIY72_01245, partial [Solobacterium sp.]|nr:hypothetical protein [Solobacterium sp.]
NHAGKYKDLVEYAFNELIIPNGVKFNITGSNDIVITGKISEPDFNRNLSLTSGQALAAQADAYNAPALTKIDFSDIKVGGDFTITIKASQLLRSTKVPVEIDVYDYYVLDNFPDHYADNDTPADWVRLIEDYPDRFMLGTDVVGRWDKYVQEIRKYDVLLEKLTPDTAEKLCRDNILAVMKKNGGTE